MGVSLFISRDQRLSRKTVDQLTVQELKVTIYKMWFARIDVVTFVTTIHITLDHSSFRCTTTKSSRVLVNTCHSLPL